MKIKIKITKLTDEALLKEACEFTMIKNVKSSQTFKEQLLRNHSPIRTQIYDVKMYGIPAFVAHHIRTHNVGIMGHWITSRRDDRGGEADETRSELVDHMFIVNAEGLINIAKQRLCVKSVHPETMGVVAEIKNVVAEVEPVLHRWLAPLCDHESFCRCKISCGRHSQLIKGDEACLDG